MFVCGLFIFVLGAVNLNKLNKNLDNYILKENEKFLEISKDLNDKQLKTTITLVKVIYTAIFMLLTISGGSLVIYSFLYNYETTTI